MEIINEIGEGIILGVLMFCLISIADSLQTIRDNQTTTYSCEVLE